MQCVQTGSYRTNRIRAGDNIWDGMDIFAGRHSDIQDFLQNPSVVLSNIRAGEGEKKYVGLCGSAIIFLFLILCSAPYENGETCTGERIFPPFSLIIPPPAGACLMEGSF